jgi:hypothetical protein
MRALALSLSLNRPIALKASGLPVLLMAVAVQVF